MRRITTCSFLAMVAASILVTTADATITQIVQDNPDATAADFAQSFVDFDNCVAGGGSTQECYKIQWDPINLKVTNCSEANQYLQREYREGWTL